MHKPEVQHRLWYGHLEQESYIYRSEVGLTPRGNGTFIELGHIVNAPHATGGSIGMADIVRSKWDDSIMVAPSIIVHKRFTSDGRVQYEVRLRWLGARRMAGSEPSAAHDLYAPDMADMMLDGEQVEWYFRRRAESRAKYSGHPQHEGEWDGEWIEYFYDFLFDWASLQALAPEPRIIGGKGKGGDEDEDE